MPATPKNGEHRNQDGSLGVPAEKTYPQSIDVIGHEIDSAGALCPIYFIDEDLLKIPLCDRIFYKFRSIATREECGRPLKKNRTSIKAKAQAKWEIDHIHQRLKLDNYNY